MSRQEELYCFYLKLAEHFGQSAKCCSRQIGALVLDKYGKLVSMGRNGPPKGYPHCVLGERIQFSDKHKVPTLCLERDVVFVPRPPDTQKELDALCNTIYKHFGDGNPLYWKPARSGKRAELAYRDLITGKCVCPRKLLGYQPGTGLHLCPAEHAERNAIHYAGSACREGTLVCACPMPCFECAKAIVQAGIKKVVYIDDEHDYDHLGRPILKAAGVEIIGISQEKIDNYVNFAERRINLSTNQPRNTGGGNDD